ncbi:Hypothetical predicted protein, partial [Paramuricea clavata]
VPPSSTDDDEGYFDDSIDRKVATQERQQDAVEYDFVEDDLDTTNKMEDLDDNEPLTDDINLPFLYKNDPEAAQDVEEMLNLWDLSEEERVDFICALQYKIVREFSKAVSLYEE